MKVGSFQVTYCTNVHPGESLSELQRILSVDVDAVKAVVTADAQMGVGVRLGNSVVQQLTAAPDALNELADLCRERDYSVFTANGFPYGDFGSGVIKSEVYRPAWYLTDRV